MSSRVLKLANDGSRVTATLDGVASGHDDSLTLVEATLDGWSQAKPRLGGRRSAAEDVEPAVKRSTTTVSPRAMTAGLGTPAAQAETIEKLILAANTLRRKRLSDRKGDHLDEVAAPAHRRSRALAPPGSSTDSNRSRTVVARTTACS